MADNIMRMGGRGDDGKAKAITTDNRGKIKINDGAGVIKAGADIVIPPNSNIVLVENNEVLFDNIEDVEFTITFQKPFENRVQLTNYIFHNYNLRTTSFDPRFLAEKVRGEAKGRFNISGNRIRLQVFNLSDEEQIISGYYLKAKKTEENRELKKITQAFDNSSKSIRTILQNSVEVEQPDAFQMSELLLDKERLTNEDSPFFSRMPPRGAKGFIASLHIESESANYADGEGVNLRINGRIADTTLTSFYTTTDKINKQYQKRVVFWSEGSNVAGLTENANYQSKALSLPLPKHLTFIIEKDEMAAEDYIEITLELGWIT